MLLTRAPSAQRLLCFDHNVFILKCVGLCQGDQVGLNSGCDGAKGQYARLWITPYGTERRGKMISWLSFSYQASESMFNRAVV